MTDKQIIIDGECLRCGAKTKKHILVCEKCIEEMGAVIAHKFTIDKQTREIKQLKKQLLRKEQECEELKKQLESTKGLVTVGNKQITQSLEKVEDLKNELHSKVEFIQEQRNIIDEYSKEIEMYKKCQGSRASKREEKLKQTLAEIKEIAESEMDSKEFMAVQYMLNGSVDNKNKVLKQILQKINEVEDEKNM